MIDRGDAFIVSLDLRVSEILDRCTRCARCVEVCPTAGPAGIDTREPAAIVGDVLDILRGGGDAASRGARWAQSCTGSGRCLSACDDGVNPRFMLAATRLKLNQRRAEKERHATGQAGFQTMSEAVKVLSRVQLPAELLARITRSARADSEAAPDVVMYLGCNVLKTPHIALLCLEVLNRIGARYKVFGGPANCCGVIQYRAGDAKASGRIGGNPRRLSRRHLSCLPSRALRPRSDVPVQDRQLPRAGGRSHGRGEQGFLQAVENDARRRSGSGGGHRTGGYGRVVPGHRPRGTGGPHARRATAAGRSPQNLSSRARGPTPRVFP